MHTDIPSLVKNWSSDIMYRRQARQMIRYADSEQSKIQTQSQCASSTAQPLGPWGLPRQLTTSFFLDDPPPPKKNKLSNRRPFPHLNCLQSQIKTASIFEWCVCVCVSLPEMGKIKSVYCPKCCEKQRVFCTLQGTK